MDALDEFFDSDGVLGELLELAHESVISDYSRTFVSRESQAERIQVFTSSHIPGLLQTEDYARELFRKALPGESEGKLSERVAARIRRQRIFERAVALPYWAIMDEAALKRPLRDSQYMVEQLGHIAQFAMCPCIEIQVIPFVMGGHPMLGGSLTLMTP